MGQSLNAPIRRFAARAACANQSARVVAALQSGLSALPCCAVTIGTQMREGRQIHRVTWKDGRDLRFVFERDAGAVSIPGLVSISALGIAHREVRQVLRPYLTLKQERELLDPDKGELRAFIKHGSLSLSIIVINDAFEHCTSALVRIAECVLDTLTRRQADAGVCLHGLGDRQLAG